MSHFVGVKAGCRILHDMYQGTSVKPDHEGSLVLHWLYYCNFISIEEQHGVKEC